MPLLQKALPFLRSRLRASQPTWHLLLPSYSRPYHSVLGLRRAAPSPSVPRFPCARNPPSELAESPVSPFRSSSVTLSEPQLFRAYVPCLETGRSVSLARRVRGTNRAPRERPQHEECQLCASWSGPALPLPRALLLASAQPRGAGWTPGPALSGARGRIAPPRRARPPTGPRPTDRRGAGPAAQAVGAAAPGMRVLAARSPCSGLRPRPRSTQPQPRSGRSRAGPHRRPSGRRLPPPPHEDAQAPPLAAPGLPRGPALSGRRGAGPPRG